jgi:hypothetical protein
MEPTQLVAGHEAIERDQHIVHKWRVTQLKRLGIPEPLAEAAADDVDWHQIAKLVQRGCPPRLALRIVR